MNYLVSLKRNSAAILPLISQRSTRSPQPLDKRLASRSDIGPSLAGEQFALAIQTLPSHPDLFGRRFLVEHFLTYSLIHRSICGHDPTI